MTELPAELCELIRRVAAHPHGLGFLHQAYLESIAVTLSVHPFVVDAAREYLETEEGRSVMIEEVRKERERLRLESSSESTPAAQPAPPLARTDAPIPPEPSPSREAEEVIAIAARHPLGMEFLLHAPLETVSVTLAVHPFLVLRARGLLRRRRRHARDGSNDRSNSDSTGFPGPFD